jgi:hypothetical protein
MAYTRTPKEHIPQICNHELNRLLRMAAPAANLQQKLPSWLKRQPRAAAVAAALFEGPRTRAGGFGEMFSLIVGSFVQPKAHFETARSVEARNNYIRNLLG